MEAKSSPSPSNHDDFTPLANYRQTRQQIGYLPRCESSQATYDKIGFISGLEVHQQLDTEEKLFCHCPAGILKKNSEYDAEVLRHMRPTLSELGEYDGTALMEFKTKKQIIYRINNDTTCTYEIDDTPPFPVNREAMQIAIRIALLCRLNIVGEVHIIRKQYLDGSIPTGFQRTAIIGVEGEIDLRHKKVRLIQLSLEEDSCREVSDIGHRRVYKTDRLGMPLIETVTYPDMVNPDEVMEACECIRFLNRSLGQVRTGMGSGRQDVNVSCRGGTRVEIKGVAHTSWIPELTHNECFRQWALLHIKQLLEQRLGTAATWKLDYRYFEATGLSSAYPPLAPARQQQHKLVAINLPGFKGILSHFTQPHKVFADELGDRLKVIACLERPNLTHSEELTPVISSADWTRIREMLAANSADAQLLVWGPPEDMDTAIETIDERCRLAFTEVPRETRKSLSDGTTIFERVLPGADRMYPDTDSAPIPLADSEIERLGQNLPEAVGVRYQRLRQWQIPEDTYRYILSKNLYPILARIIEDLPIAPRLAGTLIGHGLKHVEGHFRRSPQFTYAHVYELFTRVYASRLDWRIIERLLPVLYQQPQLEWNQMLDHISFRPMTPQLILARIPALAEKFAAGVARPESRSDWIMGQLRPLALGNMSLSELRQQISDDNT